MVSEKDLTQGGNPSTWGEKTYSADEVRRKIKRAVGAARAIRGGELRIPRGEVFTQW